MPIPDTKTASVPTIAEQQNDLKWQLPFSQRSETEMLLSAMQLLKIQGHAQKQDRATLFELVCPAAAQNRMCTMPRKTDAPTCAIQLCCTESAFLCHYFYRAASWFMGYFSLEELFSTKSPSKVMMTPFFHF